MTPALSTLCYQYIGIVRDGVFCLFKRLHLANQQRACGLYLLSMWSNLAERQHYGGRSAFEHHIEQSRPCSHAPCNKTNADPSISGGIHFTHQPSFIAVTTTDYTKAASSGYCGRKPPIRNDIHWREQDRVLNPKKLRETSRNSHEGPHGLLTLKHPNTKHETTAAKQIRTPRLLNSDAAVLIGAPSGSYVRVMKDRLATIYAKVLFFSTWPFKNEF